MRIINKTSGRETTLSGAVDLVVDDCATESRGLRSLVTRLLEELTFTADDSPPVLSARQLSRVLAYAFRVED